MGLMGQEIQLLSVCNMISIYVDRYVFFDTLFLNKGAHFSRSEFS